jgi:uncharacterized protein (DUF3084 family)
MKILEHNVETGIVTERDATASEITAAKADAQAAETELANAEANATAKAALFNRLGITADEAKLLLA